MLPLADQLADARSKRVVFVSHCLLNENTRYLGGARRAGAVQELVERWLADGVGIVQMPCPEEHAWGGVLKPRLLQLYGIERRGRATRVLWRLLRRPWVSLAKLRTRLLFRRLAADTARRIGGYLSSGFSVVGVIGVDGSPSCGVSTTIDDAFLDEIAAVEPAKLTVESHNDLVRRFARKGQGMFIEELRRQLDRRGIVVPFDAHDLLAELQAS